MKKKYFIFLLIFTFILFPKDVFAQYGSFNIIELKTYNTTAGGLTNKVGQLQDIVYNGMRMKYFSMSSSEVFTTVNFATELTPFSTEPFDISFQIFSPYPEVGVPSVSFNQHACTITGEGYNLKYDSSNDKIYDNTIYRTVSCKNVTMAANRAEIRISFPANYGYGNLLVPSTKLMFGLSTAYAYTLNSNKDLTDAIGKQTDEIKKNTEEQKKQTEEAKKQTEEQKKQNDFLMDNDTSDSQNKANNFFDGFEENSHGLSGLITAPLQTLRSLTASSCKPLSFELPIVHNKVELACMKPIYQNYFGVFFTLYQMLTTGLIAYAVGIRLFARIKGLQDPQNDKIEVFNL